MRIPGNSLLPLITLSFAQGHETDGFMIAVFLRLLAYSVLIQT